MWQVDAVLDAAKFGRTRALILQCSSEGQSRDMLVKTLDQGITETGLFCEYFGNVFAREAGLATPEPALVSIDLDTSHMINESSAAKQIGKRVPPGIAVGSQLIRPAPLPPRTTGLTPEQLNEAAAIYVYDMLVHHPDRRNANPNVVMVRGHFVAIDFDMTFSFLWAIATPVEPWQVSRLSFPVDHYFSEVLAAAKTLDWDIPINRTLSIDWTSLQATADAMPEGWRHHADLVLAHVTTIIDHRDEFRWEVLRTVS